jgi:succinyl-diaminopimelate desuccinylase
LELKFSGSPGHGSLYPTVGRSAIREALSFIEYLENLHGRKFPHDPRLEEIIIRSSVVLANEFSLPQANEILCGIMFNPGIIRGGEKANIVAQRCDMELEMRIPWGCDIQELLSELLKHSPNCTVVSESSHPPSLTYPDSRIAIATCNAIQAVTARPAFPVVQWAASDARHMRSAGFNVVEYGPGSLRFLHAIDEHVTLESLEIATRVYRNVMQVYSMNV